MSRLIILFFSSDQVFVQGRVLSSRRNPETGENLSSIPVTPGTVFDLLTHLLFASILNLSVMLGNYLQQTTSADNIFRCIFFLGALRVNQFMPNVFSHFYQLVRECSGSVVECLTRDRRAAGSSLTGVTSLWSLSKTHLS